MERIDIVSILVTGFGGIVGGYLIRKLEKKREIEISLKSRVYPALVALIYHYKHCSKYFQEAIIKKEEIINELIAIKTRLDKLIYDDGLIGLIDDKEARELLFNCHSNLGAIILKMQNMDEEILRKKFKKGENLITGIGSERPLNLKIFADDIAKLQSYVEKQM
ncbi:MAG: hypothetical protein PVF58_04010 [Candidatus Methanofastidiosia archaeon]|jgi:hypothetical protein